jgi:translocation and assembly module TamA
MAGADTQRQTDATTHTNSQQWRWGQAQDSERLDRRWVVQYDRARTVPVGAAASTSTPTPTASSAVGLYHSWAWRGYDPLPLPERGAGLHAEVGGGWTLQPRRAPFVRTHLRWKQVWPWGRASALPASRWVVRLEGGALLAASSTPVPDSQQFLTGGDHSVRGYGLRSLGVRRPDGSVTAGRWLAVGSVEWQQPWASGPQGERSPWETVLFVDGGGVADRAAQLRPHWGIGGGLRYLTPAGPLQVDLAYGLDRKRWRLHFAVGFAF